MMCKKPEKYSATIWILHLKISKNIEDDFNWYIFVQKVAEFKKSSSKKREPMTAAPLPPKNGFKKFDDHEQDLNDEQVPIRNFTYAVEGALLRWDLKDLLKVVPAGVPVFDTRLVQSMFFYLVL